MRSRAGQLSIAALVAAFAAVVAVAASRVEVAAAENTSFISGVVTSSNGPEAGVWVIAETTDFPAKLRKIVVTDDQGRFMLPELPPAQFDLWVRGYGLTDSKPVGIKAGQQNVKLAAVVARTPQEAAQSYPSNYWLSLIDLPAPGEFPGTGPQGNGIAPGMSDQAEWINNIKGCTRCHQVGSLPTRTIPDLDKFPSAEAAWDHRVERGQRGSLDELVHDRLRPPARPEDVRRLDQRHQGGRGAAGPAASDRHRAQHRHHDVELGRQRRVRARRDRDRQAEPARESERAGLRRRHRQRQPAHCRSGEPLVRDAEGFRRARIRRRCPRSSPAASSSRIATSERSRCWVDPANPHNPMMDQIGRVWMTSQIRNRQNPAYCSGAGNKFARVLPDGDLVAPGVGYYDPKTKEFTLIDTCFSTHHLQFAEDDNNTLYFSGDRLAFGWIDTKKYDATKDEQASQGWCPTVLDTNGDGKITKPWNEPATGRGADRQAGGVRSGARHARADRRPTRTVSSPIPSTTRYGE